MRVCVQASCRSCRLLGQTDRRRVARLGARCCGDNPCCCEAGVLLRARLHPTGCCTCSTALLAARVGVGWQHTLCLSSGWEISSYSHALSPGRVSEQRAVCFSAGWFQIMPPCQFRQAWFGAVGPAVLQAQGGDRGEMVCQECSGFRVRVQVCKAASHITWEADATSCS